MNSQEIFNTVVTHLLTQNARAENEWGCLYRTKDGKKCAVGCLFSDEEYNPKMDGGSCGGNVHTLFEQGLLPEKYAPHMKLLSSLQDVHDYGPTSNWKQLLINVGKDYKLDLPAELQ